MESVVFLASGGLDSTVGMYKAIEEYKCRIYPLYVRRGSRAQERELDALENEIYPRIQMRYPNLVMSLIITSVAFPPDEWKHLYKKDEVERLGYPMRDIMLQSVGVQCAVYLNQTRAESIHTVMVGQTIDEAMPHASSAALTLASYYVQLDRGDESWAIRSPLLWPTPMTKADVVRWGIEHDIPLNETWSCFEGSDRPCGKCQECIRRADALKKVGV